MWTTNIQRYVRRGIFEILDEEIGVSKKQFQKMVVTPARGVGNYRNKTKHGVLTVHFNNKKLRDIIVHAIKELQTTPYATVAQLVEHTHGKSQ